MLEMKKIYDGMWCNSKEKICDDKYEIDDQINSSDDDDRRGLSVLSYLNTDVGSAINELLDEMRSIEPEQYYYPTDELHLTVLTIITCVEGLKLSDIDIKAYSQAFERAVEGIEPFKIRCCGITASPSCILVQGFPEDDMLNNLRERLRASFKEVNLYTTTDLRYKISTAHTTIARFSAPLKNKEQFIALLCKYRNKDFGTFDVHRVDFVFNNWYQELSVTNKLASLDLISAKP